MAYAKPVRPAFVIAADKIEKFAGQKPNPEIREKEKKLLESFRRNNSKTKKII